MNLYIFNETDKAAVYGIGTYVRELMQALRDCCDINIRIIHLASACEEFEIATTNHVETWYIPIAQYNNHSMDEMQKMESYYRNVVYLLRLYIKDTKDLIFHFNYNYSQLLARELKEAFNCKTIMTIHYTKWQLEFHGDLNRLHMLKSKTNNQRDLNEQRMYNLHEYESIMIKEVDQVIALSQHMKHLLETEYQLDPDKISLIFNGINDIQPIQINDRKILRRKWNISDKESIILFVGRLDPIKGLIFLMRAFRKVLKKHPKCRLMIAGGGNYDTYLQEAKGICTKVTFTGLLEKKDLYELYRIADVGVVPSLFEPFGYVAIEIMMHRLPIVATATSGLNEVVDDTCGLKVPLTTESDNVMIDTNLLAEKILYLLQNPNERKRVGDNARKRYEELYSSEVFRKNMLNFYNSLFD